jgi:hypothetical protein
MDLVRPRGALRVRRYASAPLVLLSFVPLACSSEPTDDLGRGVEAIHGTEVLDTR